jgi:hypothetical protein
MNNWIVYVDTGIYKGDVIEAIIKTIMKVKSLLTPTLNGCLIQK